MTVFFTIAPVAITMGGSDRYRLALHKRGAVDLEWRMAVPEANETNELYQLLIAHFNEHELRELCLEMVVQFEDLGGKGRAANALALVEWAERRERLPELRERMHRRRPDVAGAVRLHRIPHLQNPLFTGREAWLDVLHQQVGQQGAVAVTQAVMGLGGLGKTQLVLEYCYRHVAEYAVLYWLRADEAATLAGEMAELAYQLGAAPRTVADQAVLRQAALDWLHSTPRRWLLVFDNADEIAPEALQPYLPRLGNGGSLITSRNPNWGGLAQTLRLDLLPLDEAVAFLRTAQPGAGAADAEHLAKLLGLLPLALEHARAYVAATGCTLADYAEIFATERRELWDEASAPSAYDQRTITTTWELAFAQVRGTAGAAELLNLCCFLDPEAIPLARLMATAAQMGDALPPELHALAGSKRQLDKALAALQRYSLVQREGDVVRLHRLVQTVARDQMPPEVVQTWRAAVVSLLAEAWPYKEYEMDTWPASAELLPHLLAAATAGQEAEPIPRQTGYLWSHAGFYLNYRAAYAQAGDCYHRALVIDEKVLGSDHPNVATDLNNLGQLLQDLGDLAGARPYMERALVIFEKVLGSNHPNVATLNNNLGLLLQDLGDLAGARPYMERALVIDEKALGPDHPGVARDLNNLGLLLQDLGDLAGARPYIERALAIDEKALGPDHPSVAIRLNNLGRLLQALGDLAGARPYIQRAYQIRLKALGNHHPDTANSLWWLGVLAEADGELNQARNYYAEAYTIYAQMLGEDHPTTQQVHGYLTDLSTNPPP